LTHFKHKLFFLFFLVRRSSLVHGWKQLNRVDCANHFFIFFLNYFTTGLVSSESHELLCSDWVLQRADLLWVSFAIESWIYFFTNFIPTAIPKTCFQTFLCWFNHTLLLWLNCVLLRQSKVETSHTLRGLVIRVLVLVMINHLFFSSLKIWSIVTFLFLLPHESSTWSFFLKRNFFSLFKFDLVLYHLQNRLDIYFIFFHVGNFEIRRHSWFLSFNLLLIVTFLWWMRRKKALF